MTIGLTRNEMLVKCQSCKAKSTWEVFRQKDKFDRINAQERGFMCYSN